MISIEKILALAKEIKERRDPVLASEPAQKLADRAPQIAKKLSIEQILEMANRIKKNTATPKPCNTTCFDGGKLVQVYCKQVIAGPPLDDLSPITQKNSGRQWTRQSIRCISESILKDFHTPNKDEIMPKQEASRIRAIVQKRANSMKAGTPIHDFWSQALDELDEYINGWSNSEINQALSQWET